MAATHLVALFLAGRAVVEPFTVQTAGDAYRSDWGGPSLAGVLAVHMLPGVLSAVAVVRYWRVHPARAPLRS